jgi:hypothetical protein
MWVIVKHIKNKNGVVLHVIILDYHGEVLEFPNEGEANTMKEIFELNSDSGYKYTIKKI